MAEYQYTQEEYTSGCFGLVRRRMIVRILLCVLGFCIFVMSGVIGDPSPINALALIAGMVAVGTVLSWALMRRRFDKIYEQLDSLHKPIRVDFKDDGIHLCTDAGNYKLIWARVKKMRENKRFFYFFESDAHARMVPKRALTPDDESLVRTKLRGSN